jgi:hypothetical protein
MKTQKTVIRHGVKVSPVPRSVRAERLATLQKRADHLAKRIGQSTRDLSYDKAEHAALTWAIWMLTEPEPE